MDDEPIRRRPRWVKVAAIVVFAAMFGGAAAGVVDAFRQGGGGNTPGGDAAAFVAAWERRLTGTWAVEGQTERSRLDGTAGELRTAFRAAQRPPDRIIEQYGSVDAQLGGRSIGCGATVEGSDVLTCTDRGAAEPYAANVAEQLLRLRALVLGDAPAYTVTGRGDGCFDLAIVKADPAPPLGDTASFCFDATTGAMVSSEILSVGVLDRTFATTVRATVTDADLALPPHEQG
jgi:hypothetical protein